MADITKVHSYQVETRRGSVRICWDDLYDGPCIDFITDRGDNDDDCQQVWLTWTELAALHQLTAKAMAEGYTAEEIDEEEPF